MDETEWLELLGVHPAEGALDQVRSLLESQTALERAEQGKGDTELMKLCCVQLFNAGRAQDALLIWLAKEASFDAHCSIDVQLLCGAGLAVTQAFLRDNGSPDAVAALQYLAKCEAAGDFTGFSVEEWSRGYSAYYTINPEVEHPE